MRLYKYQKSLDLEKKISSSPLEKPSAAVAMEESAIKGLEVLELNGSDAGIRNNRISRMVVTGYDTSPPREDVEEALKKHFESRGITLIHACVPLYESRIRCSHASIYVNEECLAKALKLDGSDMGGGCILEITAYPFDDIRLEHVFANARDRYQRMLQVTGFDTCLDRDQIKEMVRRVFPGAGCFRLREGCVLVILRGRDAVDKGLKLSGYSVRGFKIAVHKVSSLKRMSVGGNFQRRLGLIEEDKAKPILGEGNQKTVMTTH